jgi:hypothetical protein
MYFYDFSLEGIAKQTTKITLFFQKQKKNEYYFQNTN